MIEKSTIPSASATLKKGIVLLEGSFPVDHLNPGLKHVVHYGTQTGDVGVLDWFSMFCFERKNQHVKGMVNQAAQPLSSLANHVEFDIDTNLELISRSEFEGGQKETSTFSVRIRGYILSDRDTVGMQMLGVTSFRGYKVFLCATILGVRFRCEGWGSHRCGCVITTIYRGVSRYCILRAFVEVQDKKFALVTWLSRPTYPYPPFKIVVKVRMMTPERQSVHRSVISVDKIDPCAVAVMPDEDGVHFYMLREKGFDR